MGRQRPFACPLGYPYDQAILIQWFKEWDGRPARLFCFIRYGRDARATLCVSPESIRDSRPEHVFTALNTNKTPTPQGLRRSQVIRLCQTLDQGAPKRGDGCLR
jgi:hypothetical protein